MQDGSSPSEAALKAAWDRQNFHIHLVSPGAQETELNTHLDQLVTISLPAADADKSGIHKVVT